MQTKEKKRIQVILDKDISDGADAIFSDLGITVTTAVTLFYKRVIASNSIPFDLSLTPSEKAIKEFQSYSNTLPITRFETTEEIEEWLNDDKW